MIASMAAFAIEDAFLKTVTKQLPVGQVLMMFGAAGLCVFALMARRAGDCLASNGMGAALLSLASIPSHCNKLVVVLDRPKLGIVAGALAAAVGGCSQFCRWPLALACCDVVIRYFGGRQTGIGIFI